MLAKLKENSILWEHIVKFFSQCCNDYWSITNKYITSEYGMVVDTEIIVMTITAALVTIVLMPLLNFKYSYT